MCYVSTAIIPHVPRTEESDDCSVVININDRWLEDGTGLTPTFLVNLSTANLTAHRVTALRANPIQLPNGPAFPPQPTLVINAPGTNAADPSHPPFGSYRVLEARPLGGFQSPVRERNNTDTTSTESVPEGMDNSGAPGRSNTRP